MLFTAKKMSKLGEQFNIFKRLQSGEMTNWNSSYKLYYSVYSEVPNAVMPLLKNLKII